MEYEVLRQHYGDRQYWEGDTRTLDARAAEPLVAAGILRLKKRRGRK